MFVSGNLGVIHVENFREIAYFLAEKMEQGRR
jgi:hypothetical protein